MSKIAFIDNNKGSISSHTVEARVGFTTAAKVSLEKAGNEWYIYEVYTKPEYRGQGIAKQIVSYIEEEYGPIVLNSEADDFWTHMGYKMCSDGYWRKGGKTASKKTAAENFIFSLEASGDLDIGDWLEGHETEMAGSEGMFNGWVENNTLHLLDMAKANEINGDQASSLLDLIQNHPEIQEVEIEYEKWEEIESSYLRFSVEEFIHWLGNDAKMD